MPLYPASAPPWLQPQLQQSQGEAKPSAMSDHAWEMKEAPVHLPSSGTPAMAPFATPDPTPVVTKLAWPGIGGSVSYPAPKGKLTLVETPNGRTAYLTIEGQPPFQYNETGHLLDAGAALSKLMEQYSYYLDAMHKIEMLKHEQQVANHHAQAMAAIQASSGTPLHEAMSDLVEDQKALAKKSGGGISALAEAAKKSWEKKAQVLAGKRIRVVRLLIYEGDAESVTKTLAQSQPDGVHGQSKNNLYVHTHSIEVLKTESE